MAKETGGAAEVWARRVARLERSGLSLRKFAARERLKAGSLSFWKWKLAQRRTSPARAATPSGFVELTLAERPVPAVAPRLEVVLTAGRSVLVPVGFDAGELRRLVAALEEARS